MATGGEREARGEAQVADCENGLGLQVRGYHYRSETASPGQIEEADIDF